MCVKRVQLLGEPPDTPFSSVCNEQKEKKKKQGNKRKAVNQREKYNACRLHTRMQYRISRRRFRTKLKKKKSI